jgi:sterol desaturase/sphingolipid hydroxylase (fatty acid hydroxylase superfamily)
MFIFEAIYYFFLWTFCIYWIHRFSHEIPILTKLHAYHHAYVRKNNITWHWSNLFLFNDDWPSTADYWVTEVIPTIIFSWITGQWWIALGFYVYAATIQERLEHNKTFNLYPFYTSGKWHYLHHSNPPCNYGIGTPFWDWVFKTNRPVAE